MEEIITILVADDDDDIRKSIKMYLTCEGYHIIEAANGQEAIDKMSDKVHLVLLDVMMPHLNGIETCMKIRERYITPVIFLTAKDSDSDQMLGFTSGGDDYICKPFNPLDLLSRVKANIRRYTQYASSNQELEDKKVIHLEDLEVNLEAHMVRKNGQEITLTKTEFGILELLVTNRGKVFSTDHIYQRVWNEESVYSTEGTVSVHIKRIRQKIEDDIKNPKYIKTVWGVGYRVDKE